MDKNSFTKVLQNFREISVEEAQEIIFLKQRYPYSQLLHALSARVSKDHALSTHQHELQLAALYASDRSVLKAIMTADDRDNTNGIEQTDRSTHQPDLKTAVAQPITSDNVAEEVIHDLARLSQLKHNFEVMVADFNGNTTIEKPAAKNIETPQPEIQKQKLAVDPQALAGLSKKQRIVALAKAADALALAEAKEKEGTTPRKKKDNSGDVLIDEIVNTKKEIDPETDKQKQQIKIIDQFIKAQPSIVSAKDKTTVTTPPADLSTIKSGEFGDNIVSETLVDILLKQGKKDKAIEVLKKLIWKFPQKKAYFAAQIEELKN